MASLGLGFEGDSAEVRKNWSLNNIVKEFVVRSIGSYSAYSLHPLKASHHTKSNSTQQSIVHSPYSHT